MIANIKLNAKKRNASLKKGALYISCGLISACSTVVSLDDDVPPPPLPREARQLRIPADLLTNRPERSPITSAILSSQKPILLEPQNPPPLTNAQVLANAKSAEKNNKSGEMLFAPYLPTVKEGIEPTVWQKNPAYDFPWIPGAEPTRVNEETIVGAGEQMVGRLYARKIFIKNEVEVKELENIKEIKEEIADKKSKKGKTVKAISLEINEKKTNINNDAVKNVTDCDGVTCLDIARDSLVADAELKGWQMLLNRRVSLHQSFQFSKNGRVMWIELNSDGMKELLIEYSLMPKQNIARKN